MTETKIKIPDLIPVFPLPETILFPGTELPLYIYEPRYRRMLADCQKSHKMLAISLLRRGWEKKSEPAPAHDVVGVGYLRAVFDNPDGSSHIVLKGISRAKIVRYEKMEPYRVAKIRELADKTNDQEELGRLTSELKRLLEIKLRMVSESLEQTVEIAPDLRTPADLSHFACYLVNTNMHLKQDLLESTNTNFRIKHLIDLLKEDILPPGSEN